MKNTCYPFSSHFQLVKRSVVINDSSGGVKSRGRFGVDQNATQPQPPSFFHSAPFCQLKAWKRLAVQRFIAFDGGVIKP